MIVLDFLFYILYFCTPGLLWMMISNAQRSQTKYMTIIFFIIIATAIKGYFFISYGLYHGENPEDHLSSIDMQIFNGAGAVRTILFISWIFMVFHDASKRNPEE